MSTVHARASALRTWGLIFCLNLVAFVPRMVFQNRAAGSVLLHPANRPRVPGIAYELGLLLVLLALGVQTRFLQLQRAIAAAAFSVFLLFITYHEAYLNHFQLDPAIVDDVRLFDSLFHFLHDSSLLWRSSAAGGVLAYLSAVALTIWTFREFQEWARTVPVLRRMIGAVSVAIVSSLFALVIQHPPANALVQPLSDAIVVNISASRQLIASKREIFDHPPDTRYDGFLSAPLARRPNVYLLMVEAYGEILATCRSNTAFRGLLDRISSQLARSGFHFRSGYSEAPIYGGRSWLSIGTVQTGIRMDTQAAFHILERTAPKLPTLTTFFKSHGYYTMALQPWDHPRFGLPSDDIYERDRLVARNDLPYRGEPFGVAGIPDQFSLGYFADHFLASSPQPRFVFYMATSTHYDWRSEPPFVQDYRQLEPPLWDSSHVASWDPLPGTDAMTDPMFARYFREIAYEWRSVASFIEATHDENGLFLIIGDHQPFLHCEGAPESFRTPVHLIARDQVLVDRFADVGFETGLYARPDVHAPLRHEGIFSLLVSKMTGDPARYLPRGIAPSGLRR
jgi:hypothetical protein